MGSVLENGLYLPDEGERNAYNGLKGNWNTLDNLVETVTALNSTGLIRKPVDALPITDIQTNVIYMLKATKPNGDVYRIEYMYIDDHWDPLGTSETTLDDYYTKTETDDLPAVKSGINATKVSNYDTHLANNDIHVSLANKQTWDGKQNALDTAQTAAVNSGVTGTKVTGYDTHVSDTDIHVTASDKQTWNSKQDGLSQTQLAAVNSGITGTKVTGYDGHVADTDVHVTTADKAAWNGKQDALTQTQLNNIATIPDKANSADLATVATSGSYTDLINAPTIPTVNNATLTIQKNGTDVATFTANASSNVTANLSIPENTSDLNNDAGFLTQHNPIDNELSATSENALQNKVVKSELDGKAPLVHTHSASDVTSGTFNIARIPNLDASKITSGTIDIARLPKGSLERLIKVADQTARYALTADDVQLGDTVQQLDTGVMYVVTDETKLDSADGYTEFTAGSASSVPWTGVTGKPNNYPPSSHTHGNITYDGAIGTTQGKPVITGVHGILSTGSFGTTAGTFCEGNDSRLSDARTPVAHTHGKADVTDLFNSANTWSGDNTFSKAVGFTKVNTTTLYAQNSRVELGDSGLSGDSYNQISFCDKNSDNLSYLRQTYTTNGTNAFNIFVRNKFLNGVPNTAGTVDYAYFGLTLNADKSKEGILKASFRPYDNNAYDLGSSSYQWNNLYAKNYYYNGVAWGLDKTNKWTGLNTFSSASNCVFSFEFGSSGSFSDIRYYDNNNSIYACLRSKVTDLTLGVKYSSESAWYDGASVVISNNGNVQIKSYDGTENWTVNFTPVGVYPTSDKSLELGTSTNKWKTLNGINPGALSLPNVRAAVADPVDTVNWNLTGSRNTYTPTEDGWFFIRVAGTGSCAINIHTGGSGNDYPTWFNSSTGGYATLVVPVEKSITLYIYITATSIEYCSFRPCLGNV